MTDLDRQAVERARNAERLKFFTDAVVAIAMTLLILPLLESVSEAAARDLTTLEFVREHSSQLFSFVLSFVIIASFWVSHERLFSVVGTWSGRLMVLNIGWMLAIVFLPVATALVGSMHTDNLQVALYIGTMTAASAFMLAMNLVIRRSPELWEDDVPPGYGGIAASLTITVLFVLALIGALLVPANKLAMLFLLTLSGPFQRIVQNVMTRHRIAAPSTRVNPGDPPGRVR